MKFVVVKINDSYHLTIKTDSVHDKYVLNQETAESLSIALKTGVDPETDQIDLIDYTTNQFDLTFKLSDSMWRGYTFNKKKLAELRMALMGVLNG